MTFRHKFISTILILFRLLSYGQTYDYEFKNSTGRRLSVFETSWDKDSIKGFSGPTYFGFGCKPQPCGTYSQKNDRGNLIRIDLIALDDSTKDTIYVRSFNSTEIRKSPFIIDMKAGDINKLPSDFKASPYLLFETDDLQKIFKLNDTINLKLINRDKIIGTIKRYDKLKLTIETMDKKEITLNRKEIEGIKLCGALIALGSRLGMPECHFYSDVTKSKYKVVQQVLLRKPDGTPTKYVWKELK
ncbi:MAG: hypothetical protein V4635_06555 [Bacteroidota bacterium]